MTGPANSGLCGDAWTSTASMARARWIANSVRLTDGKVLAISGFGGDGAAAPDAERFDPATSTWSSGGNLVTPRYWHRSVLLRDGRVLSAGGVADTGITGSAELYNPSNNSWSAAASMNRARYAHQLALLSDGRVLATGGIGEAGVLDSAEIYDPARNAWQLVGSMSSARYAAGMVLLPDGRVLVAGGFNGTDYVSSAETFNPSTGAWTAAPSMLMVRYAFSLSMLPGGKVLAAGGTTGANSAEIFNPSTGTWTAAADMIKSPLYFFETVPMADGRVLVAGGVSDVTYEDGAEIYDPFLNTWNQLNAMSTSRNLAVSAELLDGRVLVAGGYTLDGTGNALPTSTAEFYLPCPPNLPPVARCADKTESAGPTCQGAAVSVNNGSYDPDNGPNPLSIFETPSAPFALGSTTVTLTASDGQLANQCTAKVTVRDTTGPTLNCPANRNLECVNGGATGTFTATYTDNCSGPGTVTCTHSGEKLPLGNTTVTCTATDAALNQSSCTFVASVVDTQPPAVGTSKGITLTPDGLLHEISLMDCANFTVDACYGRLNPLKDYGIITYVTSDELEDAPGGSDGRTLGDMQIKKPWLALVRAERDTTLDGRVYTLHYLSSDPAGHSTPGTCQVSVPVNANRPAVDSGRVWCVGSGC